MLLRRIKNRIYLKLRSWKLNWSFIDASAKVHKSALIESSEIYGNVCIAENCKLHKVMIGGDVSIGRYTSLWGPNIQVLSTINSITIGNFCSIARDVTIHEYMHDYSRLTTFFIKKNIFKEPVHTEVSTKGSIRIGHDVWIGTGVQIMSGVQIGNGAVIAANSVVTKDVPPYAIAGGIPAKIIKFRFSQDIIDTIEQSTWWDWDIDKIKNNKFIFDTPSLTKETLLRIQK
jgi:virginiamycin A acetyltransferase